ncbi:hypothetical protein JCM14244_12060 [Venenivibrio stagnispumantis]|uniref:6-carboxyhexanoate--CoA ligase n=1 Tax=Venenivibrio stagnispumantis TaxID=407998 RepID=A0AA45WNA6_9AQUI|nr:6-carboxyhexanoate--CoA ligase [Venenivibrio stagnispumantis]MCW4573268.1 6-carboxyhexanoate--CoA ligase [Venenivibrio stagnispumantis]SMP18080.1 hypothetical protein SAMN06264868_1173 [Venenivibrio stagnispumantis]
MSLDKQITALKEINKQIRKLKSKEPIIVGKFALTVYTQGMYPANIISLLHPDIHLLQQALRELGYTQFGDLWLKDDINVEISKDFELITGNFNQIQIEDEIINVLSLEDLIADMMKYCLEGDDLVCDLIKMLIKSYEKFIDFHYLYGRLKDKRAVSFIKNIKRGG